MSFSGKRADRMWHVLCYLFVSPDCSICYFRITTFLIWFLARGRTNNWDSHTKIWSNNKTTFVKINLAMLYTGGGGGTTPRKIGWECGPASKTLTFLWPKSAIFPPLFMTWPKFWYPAYDHYQTGTVALNLVYEGSCSIVLSVMRKS